MYLDFIKSHLSHTYSRFNYEKIVFEDGLVYVLSITSKHGYFTLGNERFLGFLNFNNLHATDEECYKQFRVVFSHTWKNIQFVNHEILVQRGIQKVIIIYHVYF